MKPGETTVNITDEQDQHTLNLEAIREATHLIAAKAIDDELIKQIDLVFIGQQQMADLNEAHLGHESPTDIITFDYSSPALFHGELIICPQVAAAHAQEFGNTLGEELARYMIHGILHLLGHDDQDPTDQKTMKAEEDRLLNWLRGETDFELLTHG